MKVGIISDLHGYPEKFRKALEFIKDSDIILCAGDVLYHGPRNPILEGYDPVGLAEEIKRCTTPMLIANGNCDAEVDMMLTDMTLFTPVVLYDNNSTRFMVMHGHDMKFDKLREIARRYKVNVMVTGHTHVRMLKKVDGVIFINPGSIGVPKGDGQPSIAIYEDGNVSFINIDTGKTIDMITDEDYK
jgi:putative phosphoesterase